MQLVEQGKLDLNEPMSHYSTDFKDDSVKIKHLLSHTSSGTPGERFKYDGNRYDYLTAVIEKKTGKPFVEVVVKTFFDPLGMSESVPYHNVVQDADKWRTWMLVFTKRGGQAAELSIDEGNYTFPSKRIEWEAPSTPLARAAQPVAGLGRRRWRKIGVWARVLMMMGGLNVGRSRVS